MHIIKLITTNKRFLEVISLILCIGFFLFGLWPFKFYQKNEVKWLESDNGISFYGQGIIYSSESYSTFSQTKSITIKIGLQPMKECACGLNRILSAYDSKQTETFFIAQWKTNLILGISNPISENHQPLKKIGIKGVLLNGRKTFLTISSGKEGTRIYIDGKLEKVNSHFSIFENNKNFAFNIILGNSPTGKHYWTGNIYSFGISDNSLTKNERINSQYLFNEKSRTNAKSLLNLGRDLIIPSKFIMLKKTILIPPWKECDVIFCNIKDTLINIAGFVPFGFFFFAYLRIGRGLSYRSSLLFTILAGLGISLTIELLQVFLPTRNSSLTDLICNIAGTAIGILTLHQHLLKN